jgi:hypothetical protein
MIELEPHQREVVDKLSNQKVMWGGTGVGKSRAAVVYYLENESPRDVYVITTARKRDSLDWDKEFASAGIGKMANATVGGILVVDSWNNIGKYENIKDAFFILDEQRLVGSGAWVKSFYRIADKNRWILLSATPGDTWLDYIPLFVANGYYRNSTQFKREHVVYSHYTKFPKVERYIGVGKLLRLRENLLVEMPFERKTVRHQHIVKVDHDKALMERVVKDRWHVYENRPLRDVAELFAVMRKVVNSHDSRLASIRNLLTSHPKLIVFYNFDYELEILRSLNQDLDVTVAEWNGHKHEEIPDTDKWVYLVQYMAGAEAWNCTDTNVMVFYSMTYSYRLFQQAQGRIDRLNSVVKNLHFHILLSNSVVDHGIWKAVNSKKNFNEKVFLQKTVRHFAANLDKTDGKTAKI